MEYDARDGTSSNRRAASSHEHLSVYMPWSRPGGICSAKISLTVVGNDNENVDVDVDVERRLFLDAVTSCFRVSRSGLTDGVGNFEYKSRNKSYVIGTISFDLEEEGSGVGFLSDLLRSP